MNDTTYASNILGATGLSRAALAAMFRNDGVFGRDSNLAAAEQAALQSRLAPIPGLRTAAILPRQTSRLSAVSALTDALVAQDKAAVRQQVVAAQAAGMSESAIAEIVTVVDNVRVVFGLHAKREAPHAPVPRAELHQAA